MEAPSEIERLELWRYEQFRDLGFPAADALALAAAGADWHLAEDLIESGCPLDVAKEIVR